MAAALAHKDGGHQSAGRKANRNDREHSHRYILHQLRIGRIHEKKLDALTLVGKGESIPPDSQSAQVLRILLGGGLTFCCVPA
jgi:hypothetical protein